MTLIRTTVSKPGERDPAPHSPETSTVRQKYSTPRPPTVELNYQNGARLRAFADEKGLSLRAVVNRILEESLLRDPVAAASQTLEDALVKHRSPEAAQVHSMLLAAVQRAHEAGQVEALRPQALELLRQTVASTRAIVGKGRQ